MIFKESKIKFKQFFDSDENSLMNRVEFRRQCENCGFVFENEHKQDCPRKKK